MVHICAYNTLVEIEWDPNKARLNAAKHGVSFSDAAVALEDTRNLTLREDTTENEQRFVSLGMDPLGRLLVVVYTYRGSNLRIISARRATKHERAQYERTT